MSDSGKESPAGTRISRFGYRYSPGQDQTEPNFFAQLELKEPSSPDVDYTVHVVDRASVTPLVSQVVQGDGGETISFGLVVNAPEDQPICVYATTSTGDAVHDRMPKKDCIVPDKIRRHDYWWFP